MFWKRKKPNSSLLNPELQHKPVLTPEMIRNSILSPKMQDEIIKNMQKFEEMQRSFNAENIPSVTDNALVIQAGLWVDKTYLGDVFHTAPKPCQYVAACSTVYNCAMNGGLSHIFADMREYIPAAKAGYAVVGMHEAAEVFAQAEAFFAQMYDENGDCLLDYEDTTETEERERELDKKFDVACSKEIDTCLAAYVRANATLFAHAA